MPDYYEGDPMQIANWIRSMETYFRLTRLDDFKQKILITLPQIRKGKADWAGRWSAIQLQEWINSQNRFEELVDEGHCPDDLTYEQRRDGIHNDQWNFAGMKIPPPFINWQDFTTKAKELFMDTETREEAIRQLQQIKQGSDSVEDYNIRFKSVAAIIGFNNMALVTMYRAGINHKLGYEIVKAGAPDEEDLDAWMHQAVELAKAYRDAKRYFGNQEKKDFRFPTTQTGFSNPVASTS